MIVEKLELENYRNYEHLDLTFGNKTNILYGRNAQGKTNILEAIFVSSTTKSHRGSADKEIIRFEKEESHIKLLVKKRDVPYRIDMHLKKKRPKGIAINGIPIKRASELFGVVNVVFFSPEDLDIIKGGPAKRRRFIDMELCQLDKIYVSNLVNYNKCLMQRNKLLKESDYSSQFMDMLDIWDMQLAHYGSQVMSRRMQFVNELNEIIFDIHKELTNRQEEIKIIYEPCIEKDDIYHTLKSNRKRDLRQKITSAGPHRDDISFYNKNIDLRKFGSQGQQRTAALSMKLAEIELVRRLTRDTPVLLLDDVLSELDSDRQTHLLNSLHETQTVITCTGLDEFVENRFDIDRIFRVEDGHVTECGNEILQ